MENCGNTIAEINYDYFSQWVDSEQDRFNYIYKTLIAGKLISRRGKTYDLRERMADEYVEFADFIDNDYDFMKHLIAGTISENLKKLIQSEASKMASVICGG